MIWESTKKRLAEIQKLAGRSDMIGEDETIVEMPPDYCPAWEAGAELRAGQLVTYKGIKYLVLQAVTAQGHQPPDMENGAMLAIYKPYQGKEGYEWVYGEYCDIDYTRYYNGELYKAIQNPNANIYQPDQVPAVWEKVTVDE